MNTFTFKTIRPTGLYRSFSQSTVHVKLNKKTCGSIGFLPPHKIRLQVIKKNINEDGNPNCRWRWVQFKKESKDLDAAKEWLNKESVRDIIELNYELFLED